MKIVTTKGQFNTDKDSVILIFNDDDEFSSFISMIVKIPIKSSGVRVVSLIPENAQLTPLQSEVLNIIEALDGIGGKENEKIVDNSIDKINDILIN